MFSSLYTENNENVGPVFKLVTDNYDKLAEAMGSYSSVATVIANIAARFTTTSEQESLKTFNEQNKDKFGSAASTLVAAEKTVTENLAWATNKLGQFRSYLDNRNGAGTNSIAILTMLVCALVGRYLQ